MKQLFCLLIALFILLPSFSQTISGDKSLCGGTAVLTVDPAGDSYQWQFSVTGNDPWTDADGTNANKDYTAGKEGFYRVIVKTGADSKTSKNFQVVSSPKPDATFTFTPTNECSSTPVTFTSVSTPGATYAWNFADLNSGGANTSGTANPTHTFIGTSGNSTQNFSVQLVVTSKDGCVNSTNKSVTTKQLPDASLGGTGATFYDNKNYFRSCSSTATSANFTFTNTSSTNNLPYKIVWGDNTSDLVSTSFTAPLTHTYSTGNYTLTYTVTGANGCTNVLTYYVFVGSNPAVGFNNPGNTEICTGSSLTFPISGTSTNPPQTTYTVTTNDGTNPVYFQHPPPASVTHQFDKTSCGTFSSTYDNSFSITIQASNPCLTSSAIVIPIYVSEKAQPEITVSPKDTVCINNLVEVSNSGIIGRSISSGVCTDDNLVWTISPSTGYTYSGILGNDFGLDDPTLWNDGSPVLDINFTIPGIYTVKLKIGNLKCGPEETTKTICVSSAPVASFTTDAVATGCVPFAVKTTNTSNHPECGANQYIWTVSGNNSSDCDAITPDYEFINSTDKNSENPQFKFNNPGTYTISLVNTFDPSGCSSPVVKQTITVKGKPKVSIDNIASICQSKNINPTATYSCNIDGLTTYNWSFPNGLPATSTSATPGTVSYAQAGNQTITLAATNTCGTTTDAKTVTVNQVPVITVPSSSSYCAGTATGTFNLSSNPSSTVSWTNDNPSTGLNNNGTGTINGFTTSNNTASTQTSNVTATATVNGCTGSNTFAIAVYPNVNAPFATTTIAYCIGQTASPLTATAGAGNTLLWYKVATGGTGSATAPTPDVSVAGTTHYYVSQISTIGNCEGPRTDIAVTVNPIPTFTAVATNPAACGASDGFITLNGLTPNTPYNIAYTKDGTNQMASLTANGSGVIVIDNLASGLYEHIVVTAKGCPSAEANPLTLSDPTRPETPVLTNNGPVCSGGNLQLNATTTSTGALTWKWSGPNGFTESVFNPTIPNVTTAASGDYFATVTINNCTSTPGKTTVVINPTPVIPVITTNSPVCTNNTLSFTNTNIGAGVTYNWTGPNSFANTNASPSIPDITLAAKGDYTVKATLGVCSTQTIVPVIVNETPMISGTSQKDPIECASFTGSIILTGLKASLSYTVTYNKNNSPVSMLLQADNPGNIVIDKLSKGVYDNIQVVINNCASNLVGPFTLSDPTPPATPVVTNSGPVCSGNALTLLATTTETGTATWSWTGHNNYVSTESNPTLANVQVGNSGDYFATVTINNCTSLPGKTTVMVNPTPVTPIITANSPVCTNNTLSFTNTNIASGVTYSWTGPNSFTSIDPSPIISNITLAAIGDYTVIATLGNCTSQSIQTVAVNETPAISSTSKTDPTQCASATGSIILTGLKPSQTYKVNYTKDGIPASQNITADADGNVTINTLKAGTYSNLQVVINDCNSNIAEPITLNDPNPPVAPIVSSDAPLCAGQTLNLKASSGDVGTYAWSGPNSFATSDQNPVIANMAAINQGTYQVTITVNNCISLPASTDVVVNPLAAAPAAPSPVEYCLNTSTVPLTATTNNGGSLNWFTTADGGTVLPAAPTPSTSVVGSVFYYVSQTTTSGCEGARTPVEVITHPDAKAAFLPVKDSGCAPFVLTPTIINLQPHPEANKMYEWYANEVLIGSGTIFPGYTIQNDHDSVVIKLKALSLFGCKDDSLSQKFFTYQLPKPAFTASQINDCGPLTITFTNNTPQLQLFSFKWIFGNGQTSTDINPSPVIFATNPSYGDTIYHVILQAYTICDTITASTDILVKSKPKALFSPDKTNGCSPLAVSFANVSKGFGTGYQWFFGDGASTTTTNASPVQHIYTTGIQDTFYAKMVATNECGTDTATYAIVVSPNKVKLQVAVNGNQTTGCAPHTVQFINASSGANTFQWNFGDGNSLNTTKNIDTVTHIFLVGGTYTVTLFASNGCSDTTTTETITVFDKPVAGYSATPLSACIGDTVSFINQSKNYDGLQWLFGDAQTALLTNPQHAYTIAGMYNATLIAQKQYSNGTICSDTAVRSITIVDHLPGAFTTTATVSTCVPFTVTFTNTTLPSVLTTWSFGDGMLDTGDVVTHTFILPGNYTVAMQAKHPAGCLYTAIKTITANGPSGSLIYTPGFVCNSTPVRFTASTANTDSIRWDFGDGLFETTTALTIYHSYEKPGIFVPSAELISGNGCRVVVATKDTIKVDNLQAGFSMQQDVICGKTTVHYTDTSHAFFGLQQWLWKLGDGTVSSLQNPINDYIATGTLPIQLITIGNSGCADTAAVSLPIKVNDKPLASINGSATACDLLTVPYNAIVASIDSVSLYQWNIMPNASYNTPDIVHTYATAGKYNVQLIAGTVYGCYDTASLTVTVSTTPLVAAGADAIVCKGNTTALTVTGNAPQYTWQPGATLSCTTCANPLAAPVSTTQYSVTGTAANGCSRTDSVLITVIQPFTLTVSEGDSICIGQSKQLTVSGADDYAWSPASTLDDPASQHPVATPLASTIYSITGTDANHCFTDTKTVVVGVGQYPVISLGKDTLLSTGTIFPLHSVVTEGGPIQTYTWSPVTDLSCSNCMVPDANVKRPVCYAVDAKNYFGCSGKDTVCIKVFCEKGQLFIANIFTPDGDGVNDKLVVQGKGISIIRSFRIFNRWGQVVFEKSGFPPNDASSGWDGMVNGSVASPDVYVYTCDVVCYDGTVYTYKGNVALVK